MTTSHETVGSRPTVTLASVSVSDYLAMRSYFVEVVRWAHETHLVSGSSESERLRARVDEFVATAGHLLGSNQAANLIQVEAARDAGLTHCDVVVHAPQMLNLANALLSFLAAIEEMRRIRPHAAPPPPVGVRAFLLACQAQLEDLGLASR